MMAKLGSFLRHLFPTLTSADDQTSSFSNVPSRKSIVIISPSTPPLSSDRLKPIGMKSLTSKSCSSSPSQIHRATSKQIDDHERIANGNQFLSDAHKLLDRRVSAPLIHHISNYFARQCPSEGLTPTDEEALMSALPRKSTYSNTGRTLDTRSSLGSATGSIGASSHEDEHSRSTNSSQTNHSNLPSSFNTISSVSGRFFFSCAIEFDERTRCLLFSSVFVLTAEKNTDSL